MRAVPPPILDQRDDDQILEQLRKLGAQLVPEWKGAKPDAGTMLHRIFTRLMEITLERLNKAPGMNLYAFLNAVGVSLLPPVPAGVPLTFSLTSGSGPALVPQGTRASTTPRGEQQPVGFETTADLTVVPAALVAAWTVDPGWDRSASHSTLIDGSGGIGFTPLLGARRLSHALFLGDERLLDFNRAEVTVTFDGPNSQEVKNQFRAIVWQYVSNGQAINLAGTISATANQITFEAVNALDQTILKGPSDSAPLRQGLRSHWLHAALLRPLAEDHGPESLTLKNLRLSVNGKGILPDFAFANAVPLDVTMPFHPFGETPKIGDAFCLTCSEALAKPNARLTLSFESTATPQKASLQWEFFGSGGWTKFDSAVDETASLSKPGNVVLKLADLILGKINGKDGFWIRVRIMSGDYGKPAEYVEIDPNEPSKGFKLKEGTGNLAPPLVTTLTLSYRAEGIPQSVVTQNGFLLTDQAVANASGFNPFVGVQRLTPRIYADTAPSLYLGFDKVFPEEPMTLFFVVASRAFPGGQTKEHAAAAPAPSAQPSVRWEYFSGAAWVELSVLDQTSQFTQSGTVDILTPADMVPLAKFDLKEIYWIRAMQVPSGDGLATNANEPLRDDPITTPRLTAIFLNTVPAIQALTVSNEILGSGNSLSGQTFRLAQSPILAGPQILVLEPELPSAVERDELLKDEGSDAIKPRVNPVTGETEIWIRWHEISSFNGSAPHSRHYTLDHGTGEVVFGDGVRGLVPALGSNNIVANYRVGAGSAGNVPKGAVAQLESPVAGVASVLNPLSADGGADIETADTVQQRGPQTLRHRGRAVSRTDFEWLAREAAGTRLARVVCLSSTNRNFLPEPGWVTLLILPQGLERRLVPSVEFIHHVEESVGSRAFAGLSTFNRLNVTGPGYVEVAVAADIVLADLRRASLVKRQVKEALDKFLHPLTGGPSADGWVLGRNVFASEIASVIQAVSGVDYLKSLQLIPSQAQHRIELASSFVSPVNLLEGSSIRSTDGRKAALLAEPVPAGTEARFLTVKGFKAGDRIIQLLADGLFSPPLTITSVRLERESSTQLVGIEPCEFEPPAIGTRFATPDHLIRLPVSVIGTGSFSPLPLRFLTLEDFRDLESVQILLPDESPAPDLPLLKIQKIVQASDVYLGGISLVCSGQHRISVSAPTLSLATA